MIAVFTRCVIDINYVQENNLSQIINTTDLEFIGGDFTDTHEAAQAIFGELHVPTVGDSRWFKVMISSRLKLPAL